MKTNLSVSNLWVSAVLWVRRIRGQMTDNNGIGDRIKMGTLPKWFQQFHFRWFNDKLIQLSRRKMKFLSETCKNGIDNGSKITIVEMEMLAVSWTANSNRDGTQTTTLTVTTTDTLLETLGSSLLLFDVFGIPSHVFHFSKPKSNSSSSRLSLSLSLSFTFFSRGPLGQERDALGTRWRNCM